MKEENILKKIHEIEDIPSLPSIVMEVNSMLQDVNTSMKVLSQTIEKDQAMVPKLFKLVNSAFFGLNSKIKNVSQAVSILGFNTVRNAIVSISIIDAFSIKLGVASFDIKNFWTHSISVAVTSKYLARQLSFKDPDEAFTAGLLHDIGKIILARYFNDFFENVLITTINEKIPFVEAERKVMNITHSDIGAELAKKWLLAPSFIDVIRYHHEIIRTVNNYNLIKIVHVANNIVKAFQEDQKGNGKLSGIHPEIEAEMKDIILTATEWFPGILENIKIACEVFIKGQ